MIQNDDNKKIVWLASFPKSGNTWLRLFIHSYFNDIADIDINTAVKNQIIDSSATLYKNYVDMSLDRADKKFMEQIANARPKVQNDMAKAFKVAVTTVKTHTQYTKWFNIPTFDPTYSAGAVVLVRNPLDVVSSLASQVNQSIDEAIDTLNNPNFALSGQGNVNQYVGSWRNHAISWYKNREIPTLIVRYEDMIANPMHSFGNILRFLKSLPDSRRLKQAIAATDFKKLKNQEKRKGFVEASDKNDHGFFRIGKSNNWKGALNKEQIKKIVDHNGDVMELFGYNT